nr:homoserine kinase [Actinopolyspora mortivallis]
MTREMTGTPERVRITVPASTANLGAGFDTLGMALGLYDTVEVAAVDGQPGTARVEVTGAGEGAVPTDGEHLVVRVLHRTLDRLGVRPPAVEMRCVNSVPHARGLGSSAAAIVAGVTAGYHFAGHDVHSERTRAEMVDVAAAEEGHADNVAACLLGGLVIAFTVENRYRSVRLEPHPELVPVVLVPESESATHTMRGLLPESVPHADAAFTAGRSALVVHALTRRPDLLHVATEDRIHQDYREPAMPRTLGLLRALRNNGVAATVSGAGPTVLALPPAGDLPPEVAVDGFDVLRPGVDRSGVRVHTEG